MSQEPRIDVVLNPVADCLLLLHLWQSQQLDSVGFGTLAESMDAALYACENPLLVYIGRQDFNPLQLGEFLVKENLMDSVHEFCRALRQMPLESYLGQLFDGEYSLELIQSLLAGEAIEPTQEICTLIDPFVWGENLRLLHLPLLSLMEVASSLIQELSKPYLPGLQPYSKQLQARLEVLSPLEVAQEEMGKRFIRISEYQSFHFLVSPFARRAMRFFNQDVMLVLTGPNIQKPIRNEADALLLLKMLADETRLAILKLLAKEKLYGKQIADRLGKTTATVSHHLDALHGAGLIRQEKQQQTKFYSFHPKALDDRFAGIVQMLSE